jgi:hypothetical protein
MKSRETGLESPLDPYQVIGWVLFVYFNFSYFVIMLPLIDSILRIELGVPYGISVILTVFYYLKLVSSNPSDTLVKKYRNIIRNQ